MVKLVLVIVIVVSFAKLWRSGLAGLCGAPYRTVVKYLKSGEIKLVRWNAARDIAHGYYEIDMVIEGNGWKLYPLAPYTNEDEERVPQDLLDALKHASTGSLIRLVRALVWRACYLDVVIRSPVWLEFAHDMWVVYRKRRESNYCGQDRPFPQLG